MLVKILTILGAALSLYFMLSRWLGAGKAVEKGVAAPARRFGGKARGGDVEDLTPCPRCGAYRNSSELCDCESAPIP